MKSIVFMSCLPFLAAYSMFHEIIDSSVEQQCQNVKGGWGDWGVWHPCSVTCGKGMRKRYRHCDSPRPLFGGRKCYGSNQQVESCNAPRDCPVDGGWGDWVKEDCSKTCGDDGIILTRRACNNPSPRNCGLPCEGENVKRSPCQNMPKCQPPQDGEWSDWKCPNCRPSATSCETTCTRKCDNPPPAFGGKECAGSSTKKGNCDDCHRTEFRICNACFDDPTSIRKGTACKLSNSPCRNMEGGIRNMYKAEGYYFLHCAPDGAWCKPCATKFLVFNPKCGQCEATIDGECTGKRNWLRELDEENLI